jgi:Zn-dependent protease
MTTMRVLMAVLNVALIIPAIILHEVSHGYVAYLLGDPTAKNAGRLTINPLAHVDPVGTILVPAVMLLVSGGRYALGWAKPVPINPFLMHRVSFRNGMLLTGAAGPATNIVLALASGLIARVLVLLSAPVIVVYIFGFFTLINLVLAFFNLIPIPPLDGSRVVQRFLSGRALDAYNSIERYGFLIVLVLVFFLPDIIGVNVLGVYLAWTVEPISQLFAGTHAINIVYALLQGA